MGQTRMWALAIEAQRRPADDFASVAVPGGHGETFQLCAACAVDVCVQILITVSKSHSRSSRG